MSKCGFRQCASQVGMATARAWSVVLIRMGIDVWGAVTECASMCTASA